jgi:hypothetical protein
MKTHIKKIGLLAAVGVVIAVLAWVAVSDVPVKPAPVVKTIANDRFAL